MHSAFHASTFRLLALGAFVVTAAGCGSYPLSGGAYPPPGKTSQELQLDVLTCQDRAKNEANTSARQAGAFALGLTIVGAPIAFELEKAKQREVYAACMSARGYRVLPVSDGSTAAASTVSPATPLAPQTTLNQPAAVPTDTAAQLGKLNDLKSRSLITEEEYQRKRKEILDKL